MNYTASQELLAKMCFLHPNDKSYNKSERDLSLNNRSQINSKPNSRFNEIYPLLYSMEE